MPADWLKGFAIGVGDRRREQALASFRALGFPTTRDEEWRFTPLSAITKTQFRPAPASVVTPELAALHTIHGLDGPRLTFVNGHFAPAFSRTTKLPVGVRLLTLGDAQRDAVVEARLGSIASSQSRAFVALNTAGYGDGVLLEVPRGVVIEAPVELVFLTAPSAVPIAIQPRVLVVAGENSEASIIEVHAGLDHETTSFSNSVTEIDLADGARIEHVKLQVEGLMATHIAALAARLGRGASFTSRSFALGSALSRQDIDVTQTGVGMETVLDGLFVGHGHQLLDHHTIIDHAKPHGTSLELMKGILDDDAIGVFDGKIIVRPDAQKTDSRQTNKNLLLSKNAVIETKPQLEIFADDVKCAHGATIGQLDDLQLFYLQSRGIDATAARAILTQAFAGEMVSRLRSEPLRRHVNQLLRRRLPGGESLEVLA